MSLPQVHARTRSKHADTAPKPTTGVICMRLDCVYRGGMHEERMYACENQRLITSVIIDTAHVLRLC